MTAGTNLPAVFELSADARRRFDAALGAFASGAAPHSRPLITCLSGGADSSALALLAEDHARRTGRQHSAIIIDHGIRPAAAYEAARTAQRMQDRGIAVTIHKVAAMAPASGVQAWARDQRYAIAMALAREQRAALLLGQHADDQAETVWMRLQRGSGLAGLAAMRITGCRDDVPVLRPLLGFRRGVLEDICRINGMAWECDPSNADRRFERVRVRAALASMTDAGPQLLRLSAAAAAIDDRLMQIVGETQRLIRLSADGSAILDASLADMPPAVCRRLLSQVIRQVGGRPYPPGTEALDRLAARLRQGRTSTLGGCRLRLAAGGTGGDDGANWHVTAETGRQPVMQQLQAGNSIVWGGRWLVYSPVAGCVRPFDTLPRGHDDSWRGVLGWQGLTAAVRASLPVVEGLDGKCVYPHLTYRDIAGYGAVSATAVFLPFAADIDTVPRQGLASRPGDT